MHRIIYHMAIFLVTALLALASGSWPGMLRIHSSGNASFVVGSHCHISASAKPEEFPELAKWCASYHKPK